jgi:hypothetical protein
LAPATIPIKLTSSCNRRNISSSSTLISSDRYVESCALTGSPRLPILRAAPGAY